MVAAKLRAIGRIIRSKQMLLLTLDRRGVDALGFGRGELHEIAQMAVEIKKSYNSILELLEEVSTEEGELHAYRELLKTMEAMNGGH